MDYEDVLSILYISKIYLYCGLIFMPNIQIEYNQVKILKNSLIKVHLIFIFIQQYIRRKARRNLLKISTNAIKRKWI
jgi:hypothetical protein